MNRKFVLPVLIVCSVAVAVASILLAQGVSEDDWMISHAVAGTVAFALLWLYLSLKRRLTDARLLEDWSDWLAEGTSMVLWVSLFILPLLGWGLVYAQNFHSDDHGMNYMLHNLHGALAWMLLVIVPFRVMLTLWRYTQDRNIEGEEKEEDTELVFECDEAPVRRWMTSAEPDALVDCFMRHPPVGFEPFSCATGMPGFWAPFDLLTTADEQTLSLIGKIPGSRYLKRWLRWRTCFMGSTVSEFCLLPPEQPDVIAQDILQTWDWESALLLVKDIPYQAPFLSSQTNLLADRLVEACKSNGFFMVEGMALAWVAVDFDDEDEYLSRLSAARRRDIRRKLRSRAGLRVDVLATGDDRLTALTEELYAQYLEVFEQSTLHFDRLSPDYYRAVLGDTSLDGRVFLYYRDDLLIGHNLCFVHGGMLVDKTIGFRYPMARENNLYFVSWMENLAFARREGLSHYIAGWTDPAVKAALGARFTPTRHAVYVRNPLLRAIFRRIAGRFEPDSQWFEHERESFPAGA